MNQVGTSENGSAILGIIGEKKCNCIIGYTVQLDGVSFYALSDIRGRQQSIQYVEYRFNYCPKCGSEIRL